MHETRSPRLRGLLQVLPSLTSGGVERGAVDVAAYVASEGVRSIVCSAGGPMAERMIRQSTAEHIRLPLNSKLSIPANIGRLQDVIRRTQTSIVHARSRAPAWSALFACRACNIPLVTTFHGVYGVENTAKQLYNTSMLRSDAIIVASRYVFSHILDVYGAHLEPRLRLIPRGVDPKEFYYRKDDAALVAEVRRRYQVMPGQRMILLPGRISAWKGQDVFLRALSMLPQKAGWVALLAGDQQKHPDFVKQLRVQAHRSGVSDRVRWVENTEFISELYTAADLTVCPSVKPEAFGRVIAESQACGTPVLATGHGGALDMISQGATGWIVPPGNAEALAVALNEVLFMPESARMAVAGAAREHIRRRFSLQSMLESTFAVYNDVVEIYAKKGKKA